MRHSSLRPFQSARPALAGARPALLVLALVPLYACGGSPDADGAAGSPKAATGPQGALAEEPEESLRFVSLTANGETTQAESPRWGAEVNFSARELSVAFGVKLDDVYMGEKVYLEVMAGALKEGEFELVRNRHGASRLEEPQGTVRFDVSTRPELQEAISQSGRLRITHLHHETVDERFVLTELDGTFSGDFRGKGQPDAFTVEGEFRYRK